MQIFVKPLMIKPWMCYEVLRQSYDCLSSDLIRSSEMKVGSSVSVWKIILTSGSPSPLVLHNVHLC